MVELGVGIPPSLLKTPICFVDLETIDYILTAIRVTVPSTNREITSMRTSSGIASTEAKGTLSPLLRP